MPSKYVLRNFEEGNYYHVVNVGINKSKIFEDDEDYKTFLYYLRIYLLPKKTLEAKIPDLAKRLLMKNRQEEVEMVAYSLMPNHFHLLLKEKQAGGISLLMKQISNAYTKYYNERHSRSGSLFMGPFKAAHVPEEALTEITRYIHLNAFLAGIVDDPEKYRWSDFPTYTNSSEVNVSNTKTIISRFNTPADYKNYVHNYMDYAEKIKPLQELLID